MRRVRSLVVVSLLAGCADNNKTHPEKPAFPTGLAVDAAGETLVVVSSNFDLRFASGAVFAVDLKSVRDGLNDDPEQQLDGEFGEFVTIPSFGDRPLIDSSGKHVFVTTRGDNLLHELQLDDGDISCGGDVACGNAPFSLQLGANDPFDVVLFPRVEGQPLRGLITHLSSPFAEVFTLNPEADDATRLQTEADSVFFGDDVLGVRNALMREAAVANAETGTIAHAAEVYVTVQRAIDGVPTGASLALFDVPGVNRGDNALFTSVDLTLQTGSLNVRGLALVEAVGGVDVIVALRAPDALARYFLDDADGSLTLTAINETCKEPTNFALLPGVGDADARLLLTCQGGEVVQSLDPVTLAVQDSVRFFGRNPYGIAVDAVHRQAFVTFFLEDTVGVLDVEDADGVPRLVERGRIGTPLPPAEDGRQ